MHSIFTVKINVITDSVQENLLSEKNTVKRIVRKKIFPKSPPVLLRSDIFSGNDFHGSFRKKFR